MQEDRRAARIASVIANRIPFQGRGAKAVREQELFASLKPDGADKPDTQAAMIEKVKTFTQQLGGRVMKATDFRREWDEKQAQKRKRLERKPDLPNGRKMLERR